MGENTRFDIIFSGEITTDFPMAVVKQKVASLFKLDTSRVEQLFINGQVALKQNVDAAAAEKYRSVLAKAGMVVTVKPRTTASATAAALVSEAPDWSIAEVGVRLSEPVTPAVPPELNSDIGVAPQEGNILHPEEVPEVVVAIELSDIEEWDLSQVGDDLLHAAEKIEREQTAKKQVVEVDVEHITVSENKGDLLRENEKKKNIVSDIDTSSIRLVDP